MRKLCIFGLIVLAVLVIGLARAEQLALSTYYPAPYGVYNEMRARRMAIGGNYLDSVANPVADNNLIVEGNVGIGTTNPLTKLDIVNTPIVRGESDSPNSRKINFNPWRMNGINIITYGDSSNYNDVDGGQPYLAGRNFGGTAASPSNTKKGEPYGMPNNVLMLLGYGRMNSDDVVQSANICFRVEESYNDTHAKTAIVFCPGNEIWGAGDEYFSASEAMRITSAGNVGIGTTNPESTLHVESASTAQIHLESTKTGNGQWELGAGFGSGSTNFGIYSANTGVLGERLTITKEGNVGIGTTNPQWAKLQIEDNNIPLAFRETDQTGAGSLWRMPLDARYLRFDASQNGTNFNGAISPLRLHSNGDVRGYDGGTIYGPSDIRLKKDIVTISNALEKIMELRGVNFRWKNPNRDDGELHMGMIAQEVEKVVPEIVNTANDQMKTKGIEYQYMVALLVEAIKDLKAENNQLKQRITVFEKSLNK